MNKVRLFFESAQSVLNEVDFGVASLVDANKTRRLSVVVEGHIKDELISRSQHGLHYAELPEVVGDLFRKMEKCTYQIVITDIVKGHYLSFINEPESTYYRGIDFQHALLLAQCSDIPIFIDAQLLMRQSIPYVENANAVAIPLNSIQESMIEKAMQSAVEEENYEIACKMRDELNRRKKNQQDDGV